MTEVAGERRHLTVLFSDLVGSTEISARLDPEEFREVVAEYHAAVADAIKLFGGHVAKYLGDGVLAYFGWPGAHDDDAERSARAGLAIIDAIKELNRRKGKPGGPRLSVRVGIDTGVVVIGRGGDSASEIFGDTANIAARIQAAAEPDTVVVSAATHRLISGMFIVEVRDAQRLKGIAEPVDLFQVLRLSGARSRLAVSASRGLTDFVGREDELRLLINRWNRARDGEGQAVLIIGEAGIGKSRLVREFREQLAGTPHTWNECAGAPYFQNTPFHPIVDMLQEGFVERGERSDEAKLSELERDLKVAGLRLGEALPLIAPLLNIDVGDKYPPLLLPPEQQRKRLLATLAGWLFGVARSQPVVMTMEDLHWFDASSLDLMQLLFEQGATSPLLVLCTARPEFRVPWKLRAHHSQLTLNRLSARDVRELIARVMAQTSLSGHAVEKVVERTGGVPLFVEELTRAVIESGDSRLAAYDIPHTLHDSLMARLDRLGAAKEVAQIASVIGGEFSYELLQVVASIPENELQSSLRNLADAELIYARGIPPDATYSFKHALVRDTAYEALLKSRRRDLHRRVARTIAEKFLLIAEAQPEVLAHHWTEAGEPEPAITAWKMAAEAADARQAFKEAEEDYRQARAMLNMLPESSERDGRELELTSALFRVLFVTRGYSARESAEAAVQARTLAEKTGNLPQLVRQVYGTWISALISADIPSAAALADQLLDLAQREHSHTSFGFAHMAQVQTRYYCGDLVGAEQHFGHLRCFLEDPGFRQFPGAYINGLGFASIVAWTLGHIDSARERITKAVAFAHNTKNPYELATARFLESWLHQFLRESQLAEAASTQLLAISEEHGFSYGRDLARCIKGWARARLGSSSEGVALIRKGLDGLGEIGARLGFSNLLTSLAEVQAIDEAIADARSALQDALRSNPQEVVFQPLTLTCRGEMWLKIGQAAKAEADFREAIALARRMSAKTMELRAATSLARMLQARNDTAAARDLICPLYGWFTEGFDTADLKEAKALLDDLSN